MSDTPTPTLGSRIRSLREAKSMTQRDLSYASGLTITTISSVEHDKVVPKIDTVAAIAQSLGVAIDALVSVEAVAA